MSFGAVTTSSHIPIGHGSLGAIEVCQSPALLAACNPSRERIETHTRLQKSDY
jgi:hypothetical protein